MLGYTPMGPIPNFRQSSYSAVARNNVHSAAVGAIVMLLWHGTQSCRNRLLCPQVTVGRRLSTQDDPRVAFRQDHGKWRPKGLGFRVICVPPSPERTKRRQARPDACRDHVSASRPSKQVRYENPMRQCGRISAAVYACGMRCCICPAL